MREDVARRLREARERAGYVTASDAARAFGWNLPSYLGHEGGKRGLRPSVAAQYARAFRVKSSWLLYGEAEAQSVQTRTLDRSVPVVGEVRAGAWTEVAYADEYNETIAVSLPEYDRASLFGLVVAGRSMDKLYAEGTVVIVCPAHEAGLRNEDHVVIRRHRNGLVETTLKQLVVSRAGAVELWPRSTDPVHQLPLKYERREHSDDGIEIIGVVVASYLPRRAGQGPVLDL